MDSVTEVLVVGAGPTGLVLTGDLARAGLGCTVLERRGEVSNLTRVFAVHARTLELLDARGLADDLVAAGARVGELRVFGQLEVDLSRLPPDFRMCCAPPTVIRVAWEVISIVRVAGGKIAERWSQSNVAGLREQLDDG